MGVPTKSGSLSRGASDTACGILESTLDPPPPHFLKTTIWWISNILILLIATPHKGTPNFGNLICAARSPEQGLSPNSIRQMLGLGSG